MTRKPKAKPRRPRRPRRIKPRAARLKTAQERLNKSQLAKKFDVSRQTIIRYLQFPEAPRSDQFGRFDPAEVHRFMQERGGIAGEDPDVKDLRRWRQELELEKLELEVQKLKGSVIAISEISPQIAALATELLGMLQAKFEMELPSLYAGLDWVGCQQLNARAIDDVVRRFKEAGAAIAGDK